MRNSVSDFRYPFACLILVAAAMFGNLTSPQAQPQTPDPHAWLPLDDAQTWYRVVRVDSCDYLEYWNSYNMLPLAIQVIHKADCSNPLHRENR